MPTYIVLTRLTPQGRKALTAEHEAMPDIEGELAAIDGKVVSQHALFGDYDFLTVASIPDHEHAFQLMAAARGAGGVERTIVPAIDMPLFVRLLGQTTETAGPHRWQISVPARMARAVLRPFVYGKVAKQYFRPFDIEGREHVDALDGPAIFIGNHTSHMDSPAMVCSLPTRYQARIYFGGAADRWFIKGRKGFRNQPWWRSLAYSSFPIKRGGGSATLDYPKWLIDKGLSIGIFPEGTRSGSGKLGKFRHGPSILALEKDVPVVPMYFQGLNAIRPKGSREMKPAPVTVRIGQPIRFAPGTAVPDATRRLRAAVEELSHAGVDVPTAAAAGG